jgi:hypothetical protein
VRLCACARACVCVSCDWRLQQGALQAQYLMRQGVAHDVSQDLHGEKGQIAVAAAVQLHQRSRDPAPTSIRLELHGVLRCCPAWALTKSK